MSQHELVLELELDAPAEKLYRCYSDPKLLQQWFAPKPWTIKSTDIDIRRVWNHFARAANARLKSRARAGDQDVADEIVRRAL